MNQHIEELPEVSDASTTPRMSLLFQLVHWKFVPLLIMAAIASSPQRLLTSQYVYQRYAESAGLDPKNSSFQNRSNCVSAYNKTGDTLQEHVQQQSASFTMYMSVAMNLPSMVALPMWGALSDIVGRKVPIIAGIGGNIVRTLFIVLVIIFHWPLWIILIGEAVHGMFGYHTHTIVYVTSAYVADNGMVESRTLEMVMVDLWLTIGMTIGSLITGYTLKDVGYAYPLIGSGVMDMLLILYTIFLVPTFGGKKTVSSIQNREAPTTRSIFHTIKQITTKSFNVIFRATNYRQELMILVTIFFISGFASAGGSEFISVYAMGYPLCWRAILLSIFQSVDLLLHGFSATFMTLLWKRKGWRLEWLLVIGIGSSALEYAVLGIATKTFLMFIGICIGAFYILTHASGRSIGASMITPTNQGTG